MRYTTVVKKLATAAICLGMLGSAKLALATVPSVTIKVPRNAPAQEISKMKVSISVATELPVTFQITSSRGYTTLNTLPIAVGSATCFDGTLSTTLGSCLALFSPTPGGSHGPSTLFVSPASAGLPAGDPGRRKFDLIFNLDDNVNTSDPACLSTDSADETFTITVTAGPQIDGICVESLQQDVGGTGCNSTQLVVISQAANIATVENPVTNANLQGCRVGVDVMMVLDRSGSMSDPASGGGPAKITRLHSSVTSFINMWDQLRTNESSLSASPRIVSPADRVGLVYFDNNRFTLHDLVAGSTIADKLLHPFDSVKADILANDQFVTPGGSTSIGGGLVDAASSFPPADPNRQVILLMSDGIHNTPPPIPAPPAPAPIQVYPVTVGTGIAVDEPTMTNIANASHTFTLNTEPGTTLPTLFVELLQNFIKYSTVETLRVADTTLQPGQPFQSKIPVTSTTHSLTFHVNWVPVGGSVTAVGGGVPVRLTVTPPNGGSPLVETSSSGTIILNRVLPLRATTNPAGDWDARIEMLGSNPASLPVSLIVLGDDVGLNSDMVVVGADYVSGGKVRVTARVNELGKRMLGLGSNTGDKMLAQLLSPGQSLGDLLSDSNASADPSSGPDPKSAAETKLQNFLKANPQALAHNENILTLKDDGSSASGDDAANDGVYSATFPVQLSGHYILVFGIEGKTQNLGRFSRQQLKTIYVRPAPDNGSTQYSTSIVGASGTTTGSQLIINMTPKTKSGNRLGPGWANYFWFVATGQTPVKAKDNLNGTYTASISFSGAVPPPVKVHFLGDGTVIIPDDTTGSTLPVPLGDKNALGNVPSTNSLSGKIALFADIGPGVPLGNFSNVFTTGVSFNGGAEYIFNAHLSAEGIFGVHYFPGSLGGNLTVVQFTGGAKAFVNPGPNRFFVRGGVGGYHFNVGSTTEFGGYVGPGFLHEFNSRLGLELGATFHGTRTPANASWFAAFQIGIRYVLP
jgi:hypothetical protein